MKQSLFPYLAWCLHLSILFTYTGFTQTQNSASIKGTIITTDPKLLDEYLSLTLRGPIDFLSPYKERSFETKPDSLGQFYFEGLNSGTYYLYANSPSTYCSKSLSVTDTLILKPGEELQHNYILGGDSIHSPNFPDRGIGQICLYFTDSLTGKPVPNVHIDFFRILPKSPTTSINYEVISQYQYRTDSSGNFCIDRLCHGTYSMSYHYYVDGQRKNLGYDSIYVHAEDSVMLAKKVIVPQSVRPTETLLTGNVNLHLGLHPTGELALGVGHLIATHRLEAQWETIQAGCEFNFRPSHFIIGPKLTYSYSRSFLLIGFNAGGSVIYYTDFANGNFYLHPHLGVSIMTVIDLYVGYNIPLSNSIITSSVNNFTLSIAIPILNRKRLML